MFGPTRPHQFTGIKVALACLTIGIASYPGDLAQAKPCGMVDGSEVCLGEIDPRSKLSEQEFV
ncbi:MAG: hypothetical protein AAFR64_00840 [Pseudomonadota bacterium]